MSSRGAKKTGRPTIHDIAASVGVSAITVSRALRTPALVSDSLRERIRAEVDAVGYVSNRIAGNLSIGRSNIVAVVVPNMRNAFFASTIDTMSAILEPAGFQILIASSRYDAALEEALIDSMTGWHPTGIVLIGTGRRRELRTRLRRSGILVIETWDYGREPIDALIGFEHRAAGHAIGVHLAERGYRAIGFLGAALQRDVRAAARRDGFRDALRERGLSPVAEVAQASLASVEAGGHGIAELLSRGAALDAVFCSNDILALGALFECQRRGVHVPRDLAIAGFGDLDASACSVPPLTTVRPPGEEIGRRAAELLLKRARDPRPGTRRHVRVDLGFSLIERASTHRDAEAPAAGRARR